MAILVTGGGGYIGSQMAHELLDAGERVVVLGDLSTGFRWAVPENAHFAAGDCGDQAFLTRLFREHGVEAIIHFAAFIVVPDSVRDPLRYYRNNTVNSRALIESAIECGIRHFIFSSTAAVYGNPAAIPVDEDASTRPISPYGWSKLMTEIMLRDASRAHGLNHVILRYFNVAGADPQGRTGQSSAMATHLAKSRRKPHCDCVRSSKFSATTIQPRMALASGITFTSAILPPHMRWHCSTCARAGHR
jgi:UDP-glucose 4-epimerase